MLIIPLCFNFQGRRFRFGTIAGKQVVLVMTGLAMVYITCHCFLSFVNLIPFSLLFIFLISICNDFL